VWYRNINRLSIAYGCYALGLGPTNPTRMYRASETLGFRWTHFACALSLLIPAFALPLAPRVLAVPLHSRGTLPYHGLFCKRPSAASVVDLSPDTLSARGDSTSELLRTLSRMAASKPTSWLFASPHFL
jgi:hypothetical protein